MEDPDAKERAQNAVGCSSSFIEAVKLLKSYYYDNRLLHRHFLDKLTQMEQFGCKGKDLDYLQTKLNSAVKGLKDSNGYSADQIIVAILVNMFDKHLLQGWRQHIHDLNDPPDTFHLQSFLDYQRTILSDDRFQSSTRLERDLLCLSHYHQRNLP